MERFRGTMQRAIRSRRFPYASVDRYVVESAQLHQIANLYNVAADLSLQTPRTLAGAYSHPKCMWISPNAILFNKICSPTFKIQRVYCFHRNLQTGRRNVLLQELLLHLPLDSMPMSALSRTI
jgi:hypothetical protein